MTGHFRGKIPKSNHHCGGLKLKGFFGIKNKISSYFHLLTLKHPKITKQNQPNLKNINRD